MLSIMAKGFFQDSPLMLFPVVALFIFIAVFTAVTVRALRTEKSALMEVAGLPLADDMAPLSSGGAGGD